MSTDRTSTERTNTATRVIAALAAVVVSLTTFATAVGGAPLDPVGLVKNLLKYAVDKPVCNQPSDPAAMRCYAYERVQVAKGTSGAYAYRTAAARGPAGGYTPADLATAYGYNPKVNRSSTTVAIVLWYDAPSALADLNTFDKLYGLPRETSRSFRKVNQKGSTAPLPQRDRGSSGEVALDVQAVRSVCRTCRILLVEANGPYESDLAAAENTAVRLGASVVSNSYGAPERRVSSKITSAYNHPGVAIIASTGDEGWLGWDYANRAGDTGDHAASFPATSPYVVAVGGTTLTLSTSGRRSSETVWNSNGAHDAVGRARRSPQGASGGGCSKLYSAQPWQSHYPGYAAARCGGKRLVADMSLVADPQTGFDIYDSYGSGGWITIGGTSLSAPLAAGMFALAGGAAGAAYPSSALYTNGRLHPSLRFDVRSGGTGYCDTDAPTACADAVYRPTLLSRGTHNPNKLGLGVVDCSFSRSGSETVPASPDPECAATGGFDGPSGVGTPTTTRLFTRTDPTVGIKYHASGTVKKSMTFTAKVKQLVPATRILKYTWSWGDGKTSSTTSKTIHHRYTKKGKRSVHLTIVDSRYQVVVRHVTVTIKKKKK